MKQCKDVLGKDLNVGDLIIFYFSVRKKLTPGKVVEQLKGDLHKIEIGYFLKNGEPYVPPKANTTTRFSTELLRIESL